MKLIMSQLTKCLHNHEPINKMIKFSKKRQSSFLSTRWHMVFFCNWN